MKSQLIKGPFLCMVMALVFTTPAQAGGDGPQDPPVQGFAMVQLDPGASLGDFLAMLNVDYPTFKAHQVDTIESAQIHLIAFNPPTPLTLEVDLQGPYLNPGPLKWGEVIYEGQAPEGKTGSIWVDEVLSPAAYEGQYASGMLGLQQAAKQSTGGVVVAVLDTGIDATHPQFAGKIAAGGYNFITNSTNVADVGDGIDNDGDGLTDEMAGHGTYVAGLVNLVAPDAKLLPITVLDSEGVGNTWAFLKGIHYAMNRGVEVMNLSLGTTYDSMFIYDALYEARNHGIIVVASAGNANTNDNREYPACMDVDDDAGDEQGPNDEWLVFGVAATNHQDQKASFSNYHKNLFICAPGDSVIAAGIPNLNQSIVSTLPGGDYYVWEGTSMSTPLVSGAAALIRAQHPEWPATVQTFFGVRDVLIASADNIYPLNPQFASDNELGVGRLDISAAVALGPPAPSPGDLDGNGVIAVEDLLQVISDWGLIHSSADIDGDGVVDVDDLLFVINHWG